MKKLFRIYEEIKDYKMTDLVEANYPGQSPSQMPIYLILDMQKEPPFLYFDTWNFQLNGTPVDIWHNRRLVWDLPNNFDASTAIYLIDALTGYFNAFIRLFEIDWDGHNMVGVYNHETESLGEAMSYLQYKIDETVETYEEGGLIDFGEWIGTHYKYNENFCQFETENREFKITARTNDKALDKIEQIIESEFEENNWVSDVKIGTWLYDLRDSLREEK